MTDVCSLLFSHGVIVEKTALSPGLFWSIEEKRNIKLYPTNLTGKNCLLISEHSKNSGILYPAANDQERT